jgi:hypothetical protein
VLTKFHSDQSKTQARATKNLSIFRLVMSITRTPTFTTLLLAIALSFVAVATATSAPTLAPAPAADTCGAIVIRSILNDGHISPHRVSDSAGHDSASRNNIFFRDVTCF